MASVAATHDPEFYRAWSRKGWRRDLEILIRRAIEREGALDSGYVLWKYLSIYSGQKRALRRYGLTESQVHSWLVNSLRLFIQLARTYKGAGITNIDRLKESLCNIDIVKEVVGIGVVTWEELGSSSSEVEKLIAKLSLVPQT